MKIYKNGSNGGDSTLAPAGFINVNSKNPDPITTVATAAGVLIGLPDANPYDFFAVAQTSAGTDSVRLASELPVGTTLEFFAISAFTIKTVTSSGIGINGGTDAQGVAIAANTSAILRKVSATRWICTAFSTAGAVTAPTPA